MDSDIDAVFRTPPVDGIDSLPKTAGIYAMLNRATRMVNIGQAENIRRRCAMHRSQLRAGTAPNMRMRRDPLGQGLLRHWTIHILPLWKRSCQPQGIVESRRHRYGGAGHDREHHLVHLCWGLACHRSRHLCDPVLLHHHRHPICHPAPEAGRHCTCTNRENDCFQRGRSRCQKA